MTFPHTFDRQSHGELGNRLGAELGRGRRNDPDRSVDALAGANRLFKHLLNHCSVVANKHGVVFGPFEKLGFDRFEGEADLSAGLLGAPESHQTAGNVGSDHQGAEIHAVKVISSPPFETNANHAVIVVDFHDSRADPQDQRDLGEGEGAQKEVRSPSFAESREQFLDQRCGHADRVA